MEHQVGDVKVVANTYKAGLNMYIFYPPQSQTVNAPKRPLVLCFPGGGWKKFEYTTKGIENVDQSMEDAFAALTLASADAQVDSDKICVMGNSAGGQIAASLLFCRHENYASCPQPKVGVLSAPVLNLTQIFEHKSKKFSEAKRKKGLEGSKRWCPRMHLSQSKPQLMIAHGTEDSMVSFGWTREFVDAFKEAGNEVRLCAYEGYEHKDWYYGNPYTRITDGDKVGSTYGSSEKGRSEVHKNEGSLFSVSLLDTIKFLVDSGFISVGPQAEDDLWAHLTPIAEALFKI